MASIVQHEITTLEQLHQRCPKLLVAKLMSPDHLDAMHCDACGLSIVNVFFKSTHTIHKIMQIIHMCSRCLAARPTHKTSYSTCWVRFASLNQMTHMQTSLLRFMLSIK